VTALRLPRGNGAVRAVVGWTTLTTVGCVRTFVCLIEHCRQGCGLVSMLAFVRVRLAAPCYARREKNKKAPSHIVGGAVDAARETLSGLSSQAEKPATKEAEGVAKEEESGAVHMV
jgi:hypothetical protein